MTKTTEGTTVSVDAILDKKRSKRYFSTDATAKGIVPVYIRVANVGHQGSVLVRKEAVSVAINAGAEAAAAADQSIKTDSKVGTGIQLAGVGLMTAGAVGAALPLILIGGPMVSNADKVHHNFITKEYTNQSVPQGGQAEGFIYFSKQTKEPIRELFLQIPVEDIQTQKTNTLTFLVRYDPNQP